MLTNHEIEISRSLPCTSAIDILLEVAICPAAAGHDFKKLHAQQPVTILKNLHAKQPEKLLKTWQLYTRQSPETKLLTAVHSVENSVVRSSYVRRKRHTCTYGITECPEGRMLYARKFKLVLKESNVSLLTFFSWI